MRSWIDMGSASFADSASQFQIPAAVALAADAEEMRVSESFGGARPETIFAIASMTKAVTTVAALQLVEAGAVTLDEPVRRLLPELGNLPVVTGFNRDGGPIFHPIRHDVTLRQLLTHTAGFAYPWNHPFAMRLGAGVPPYLVHAPGSAWHYGTNVDWVGRLIEAAAGQDLETYFQDRIFKPLGMIDSSFLLPAGKFDRLATNHQRNAMGELLALPRLLPSYPPMFNGGGGLYSTAADYIRFLQMFLRRGVTPDGHRMIGEASILAMSSNQTGELAAGRIQSVMPVRSCDVDFHPGVRDRFGFGFLINPEPYAGGRSAGSLAWGGIRNTFFWIDPARGIAAVLLMQFQPFCDPAALGLLDSFEKSVYRAL